MLRIRGKSGANSSQHLYEMRSINTAASTEAPGQISVFNRRGIMIQQRCSQLNLDLSTHQHPPLHERRQDIRRSAMRDGDVGEESITLALIYNRTLLVADRLSNPSTRTLRFLGLGPERCPIGEGTRAVYSSSSSLKHHTNNEDAGATMTVQQRLDASMLASADASSRSRLPLPPLLRHSFPGVLSGGLELRMDK